MCVCVCACACVRVGVRVCARVLVRAWRERDRQTELVPSGKLTPARSTLRVGGWGGLQTRTMIRISACSHCNRFIGCKNITSPCWSLWPLLRTVDLQI